MKYQNPNKKQKPRAGCQIINNIEFPENITIKKNKENEDVYISGISIDSITFRRITNGSFYTIPFNQKIINIFTS